MNQLQKNFAESNTAVDYVRRYLKYLSELLSHLDANKIAEIIDLLYQARNDGRTVYLIGNGGSAACSSHWANDLCNGTKVKGKKFIRAVSLTDNVATLTALGNDIGYDNIFVAQLENLLQSGDIVIGISASGNSPNVVKAFEYANSVGAITVGLIGFDGGKMKEQSKVVLHIVTGKGEYGPVEDIQMILDHVMTTFLRQKIEKE
ncbi:SIS domain-containing protein [bacterium]|nr:SIS domain-containing protein [bacterium]